MKSILLIIMVTAIVIAVVYVAKLLAKNEDTLHDRCSQEEPCDSCICGRKIGNTL